MLPAGTDSAGAMSMSRRRHGGVLGRGCRLLVHEVVLVGVASDTGCAASGVIGGGYPDELATSMVAGTSTSGPGLARKSPWPKPQRAACRSET